MCREFHPARYTGGNVLRTSHVAALCGTPLLKSVGALLIGVTSQPKFVTLVPTPRFDFEDEYIVLPPQLQ